MGKCSDYESNALKELGALARNNYFYGKLLNVEHFCMEQNYFNRKRWLLNRLGLGSGVLCGLEVTITEDGQMLWIEPGVAIDPLGREIIIPVRCCLRNPRQPTDAMGLPCGQPIQGEGVVTISLAYHECKTEMVPVMVSDCDTRHGCAPSIIIERFKLLVQVGFPAAEPVDIPRDKCEAIFPHIKTGEDFNLRCAADQILAGPCHTPEGVCVVLATVALPKEGGQPLIVDAFSYRRTLYSNSRIFELLLCLAEHMAACCQKRTLHYVSGNAQEAGPGVVLSEPIVVRVIDGEQKPAAKEQVNFRVLEGDGGLGNGENVDFAATITVYTEENGVAQVNWRLGAASGLNSVEATIDSGSQVVFYACNVQQEQVVSLPVILATWPPNAHLLSPNEGGWEKWKEEMCLEITFDRQMDEGQCSQPEEWLHVYQVIKVENDAVYRRIDCWSAGVIIDFNSTGWKAVYRLATNPEANVCYLVLIRAADHNIVDTNRPPLLLDAEFGGTDLVSEQIQKIWEVKIGDGLRGSWNELVDPGRPLPSGNGKPGGLFHGWFEVRVP